MIESVRRMVDLGEIIKDPEDNIGIQLIGDNTRTDSQLIRVEVIQALQEVATGDRPKTILGVLAVASRTLPEIAARTELLPDEVSVRLAALQRAGIILEDDENQPYYSLHPHPSQ